MFIVALFQTNYYLGRQRNCKEKDQNEEIQRYNEKNEKFGVFDFIRKPIN